MRLSAITTALERRQRQVHSNAQVARDLRDRRIIQSKNSNSPLAYLRDFL